MYYNALGLSAARFLKAQAIGRRDVAAAIAYAEARHDWGQDKASVVQLLKSGVSGLATGDTGGASDVAADLMLALREITIVGRLPLRKVGDRVPFMTQTGASRAFWAGQGKARKVCAAGFTREAGFRLKAVAAMTVATNEQLEDPSTDSEKALLADLLAACGEALDRSFLDRTNTGSSDAPASVTSTATPISSSGGSVAALDSDLAQCIRQLTDAGSNLRSAYWIMSSAFAGRMALMRGADGALAWPTVGALGGSIAGLPLLTSGAAAAEVDSDDLADIALLDASQISLAEGPPVLKTSQDALIEMDDAPTGNSIQPTAASAHMVSMFQVECTALYAQLNANWKVRRPGMVQVISGVGFDLES